MRLLVGVDQDEVLCRWVSRIVQWYNEDKYKEHAAVGWQWQDVSESDVTNWSIHLNLGEGSEPYVRSYMRSTLFYPSLEPIPGAVEGFQKILDDTRFDVMLVTAVPKCSPQAYDGKMAWMRRYFPGFNMDNFIAAKRKDMLDLDVLIDDGLHNLQAAKAKGVVGVAFDRPWNKDWDGARVKSWDEVPSLLSHIYDMKNSRRKL